MATPAQGGTPEPPPTADAEAATALAALLEPARQALERGDYGRVRRLLEPLAEAGATPRSTAAAELRLLLATALMGQGDTAAAARCCRSLRGCGDAEMRARGRALEEVLEAPALQRPRNWSITLPDMRTMGSLETTAAAASRPPRRRQPEPPPPPPVGPTRAPIGFAALVAGMLAVLLLASLLGGCVEVRTDLHFQGPGRLQISHQLSGGASAALPWQRGFEQRLEREGFQIRRRDSRTLLSTAVLPLPEARAALVASVEAAAAAAAQDLPAPRIEWRERNAVVGVRQHLRLEIDLRGLPALPGLQLDLGLEPLPLRAVRLAAPEAVTAEAPDRLRWPLRSGSLNRLEVRCWRWNPLGLGSLGLALLLPLVLGLQSLRRQLGFGLPELPA